MSWYAMVVLAPVCGLFVCGLAHIAFNWLTRGQKLLKGFLCGIVAGWVSEILVSIVALGLADTQWPDAVALGGLNQVTYLALAYGYSNAINILITALRIRILHEVAAESDGLTTKDLLDKYNARDLVETRLRRLVGSGRLRCENGRYYSAPNSMLALAKLCRLLKVILLRRK